MSSSEQHEGQNNPPYFDESLIVNSRLSEIERQQREDKAAQRKHERSQRITNWLLTVFTALLVITALISDVILIRQTRIARDSAEAAKSAADAAKGTLEEVKKGSSDTHALTLAARQQASNSEALARNASRQAEELRNLSQASAKTANAAVLQSQTSANELQAAERPWIAVEPSIKNDLVFLSGTLNVSVHFVMTNTGHSPAMNTFVFPEIYATLSDIPKRQEESCRSDRETFREGGIKGETVLPNHSEEIGISLHLGPEVVEAQARQGNLYLTIAGCVTYGSSFDAGIHQTGFLYDLIRNDPAEPSTHFIRMNVDVPKSNLGLRRIPLGYGRFAN